MNSRAWPQPGRLRFESLFYHGSLLGDLGEVTRSQSNPLDLGKTEEKYCQTSLALRWVEDRYRWNKQTSRRKNSSYSLMDLFRFLTSYFIVNFTTLTLYVSCFPNLYWSTRAEATQRDRFMYKSVQLWGGSQTWQKLSCKYKITASQFRLTLEASFTIASVVQLSRLSVRTSWIHEAASHWMGPFGPSRPAFETGNTLQDLKQGSFTTLNSRGPGIQLRNLCKPLRQYKVGDTPHSIIEQKLRVAIQKTNQLELF